MLPQFGERSTKQPHVVLNKYSLLGVSIDNFQRFISIEPSSKILAKAKDLQIDWWPWTARASVDWGRGTQTQL